MMAKTKLALIIGAALFASAGLSAAASTLRPMSSAGDTTLGEGTPDHSGAPHEQGQDGTADDANETADSGDDSGSDAAGDSGNDGADNSTADSGNDSGSDAANGETDDSQAPDDASSADGTDAGDAAETEP